MKLPTLRQFLALRRYPIGEAGVVLTSMSKFRPTRASSVGANQLVVRYLLQTL